MASILYEHSSVLLKIQCDCNKREFASCNDNFNAYYAFLMKFLIVRMPYTTDRVLRLQH
jgi:hypothetical protein